MNAPHGNRPVGADDALATVSAWLETLADRNPLAVRQVRQQLRGRVHSALLIALPLLGVAVHALALSVAARGRLGVLDEVGAGLVSFPLAVALWTLVAWVVVPWIALRALRTERGAAYWDQLELTGLGGPAIATGAWLAAVLQGLLAGSLFAPFLVIAWLSRGVDLAALLQALVVVPLWTGVACAIAINDATVPGRRRGIQIGAPLMLILGWLVGWWFVAPPMPWWTRMGTGHGILVVAIILGAGALLANWLLAQAGANLSHPADDRSSRPRLAALCSAVAVALIGAAFAASTGGVSLAVAALLVGGLDAVAGLTACSEHDGRTSRQRRWHERIPRWLRWLGPVLAPGCRAGRRFHLLLAALALLLAGGAWLCGHRATTGAALAVVAYVAVAIAGADILTRGARGPFASSGHRPRTMVTVAVALALGSAVAGGLLLAATKAPVASVLCWPVGIGACIAASAKVTSGIAEAQTVAVLVAVLGGVGLLLTMVMAIGPDPDLRLHSDAVEPAA